MTHWYGLDGSPVYTIKGAKGKERKTTLRDARKHALVVGTTTITGLPASYFLERWKIQEALKIALKNPFDPLKGLPDDWFLHIEKENAKSLSKKADNGKIIHDALETAFKEKRVVKCKDIVNPVIRDVLDRFQGFTFYAEESFGHIDGFGGCVDLYGISEPGTSRERRMVLDFKTKQDKDIDKIIQYDDHHMQTAAYVKGLEDTKNFEGFHDYGLWERYNLFVGYEEGDGELLYTGHKICESTDFERDWGMFEALLNFWKIKNNYDPKEVMDNGKKD